MVTATLKPLLETYVKLSEQELDDRTLERLVAGQVESRVGVDLETKRWARLALE